ncbi:hypothetical protein K0M31_017339 [Melipona bicolor]|uniref:Uncharacterized protein n=1 Tax=Melipona bicolor TaxID=60889 RepID=A0AA40KSC3_9HYME|nr:hypothetical protein K0M31_017339 [Melipona bicolor]
MVARQQHTMDFGHFGRSATDSNPQGGILSFRYVEELCKGGENENRRACETSTLITSVEGTTNDTRTCRWFKSSFAARTNRHSITIIRESATTYSRN